MLAPLLALAMPAVALSASRSLEEIRAAHDLPALSRAILHDGKLAVETAGVRKAGSPARVQRDDRYHLGSCTKAMTATLVALYVERKKLRWDQTLGELLPDLDIDPALKNVTVEMLLAHRSGLAGDLLSYGGGSLWRDLETIEDPAEGRASLARAMLGAPPASKPGSRFEYSNANYVIAGLLLEKVSGRSWEDLIRQELFQPLGMQCVLGPAADESADPPDQPWAHARDGAHWKPTLEDNPPALNSAGRVSCSLPDWAKFAQLHLDGAAGRPTKLLHPASFKKLHEAYPGQEYTYGGWLRVTRAWAGPTGLALTHEGSNTLNTAVIWLAPEKDLALLAATNAGGPEAHAAVDQAVAGLLSPR